MAIAYRVQMLDKVFAWSELDLTNVEEAIKYSNSALPCCEVDSGQNSCSFYEGSRKTWNISIFKYNYAKQRLASSWDNVLLHSKLSRNSVAYIWIMCYFECGNWHILQIFNVWSLLLVLVQSGFVNWFYWHHVRWGLLEHIGQFALSSPWAFGAGRKSDQALSNFGLFSDHLLQVYVVIMAQIFLLQCVVPILQLGMKDDLEK